MSSGLPAFLKKYFWDVDFEKLDFSKRRFMTLKRLMEHGDREAVAWMLDNFSRAEIRDVLLNCRDLSRKSANFWAVMTGVDREKVKCLSGPFRETQRKLWPF